MRQEQKSASDQTTNVLPDSIPESADHTPPFAHSLRTLLRLLGRPVSLPLLLSGIRGGPSSDLPSACLRSAKRYGLDASITRRKNLATISPLVLPCILLLKNGQSFVLLEQNAATDTAEVIFPESSEQPKSVNRQQLEEEYTGYAVFGSLTGKPDDGPRDEVLEAIRSQKPQSQMFSASATRDHKNAAQANTATEHNAGEILKGRTEELPPTSPPATSQGSRNDNILGAI